MIEVNHLTKKYGDHTAVSDLSFTIEKGHIYGFLGPNGAGKSTTMNIMTGCLAATSGEVRIGGHDIFEEPKEAKKLIGYLPEMPPLYVDQTPEEYLRFVAAAKGVKKADIKSEIEKVVGEAHIEEVKGKLIKHLSKGYKQRVGIAQALLGNPEVIILDEPTVGLDPMQIIEIRDLIKTLGETHTVILSSHVLSEVQAVCEKVLIIYKGKLIAFDDLENLGKTLESGSSIEVTIEGTEEDLQAVIADIPEVTGCKIVQNKADKEEENGAAGTFTSAVLQLDCKETMEISRKLSFACASAGKAILRINPIKATLEDIFIELTSQDSSTGAEGETPELSDELQEEIDSTFDGIDFDGLEPESEYPGTKVVDTEDTALGSDIADSAASENTAPDNENAGGEEA